MVTNHWLVSNLVTRLVFLQCSGHSPGLPQQWRNVKRVREISPPNPAPVALSLDARPIRLGLACHAARSSRRFSMSETRKTSAA